MIEKLTIFNHDLLEEYLVSLSVLSLYECALRIRHTPNIHKYFINHKLSLS